MKEINPACRDLNEKESSQLLHCRIFGRKHQLLLLFLCMQILIVTCSALPIDFGESVPGTLHFTRETMIPIHVLCQCR